VTAPTPEELASLSREFALVCDPDGRVLWADARAERFGIRSGVTFSSLCVVGTEAKAAELFRRAAAGPVDGWEMSLVLNGTLTTTSLSGVPRPEGILLVGQPFDERHAKAFTETQAAFDEIITLNREIARQKGQIVQSAEELARTNSELRDSNRGVIALHRELEDRADALAHSSEIKSRVVSSVSHEFRTPLNSIIGLSQLLSDGSDGPLNDEQQKQVRFIRSSAEELMTLVNDLLDLSKIEAGRASLRTMQFTASDLAASLRGSFRPLIAENAPVTLTIEAPEPDFELDTDRAKLSQILRNLVSNALKFTPRGEVRVTIAGSEDGRAVFSVRDTGIGIPRDAIEHVFEEFTQIDNPLQGSVKGTGLGLPIAKRLSEFLGGELTVDSTVGEGSTFTVTLPTKHPDVIEMQQIERRSAEADPGRVPVLVVEDDRRSMFVYERYLAMAGFRVVPARTVQAAREALARELPAAIVLDIVLEDETTWAFLADVKRDERTHNVPVLVVTVSNKRERARALGADEFWLKPIDPERLLSKLKTLVRPGRPAKVLVIDDDERSRYLIRKHLTESNYELLEAATGADGVRLAQRELPHVIFLDFLLEESTAFDVIDDLKANPHTRSIPIVVVTSHVLDAGERTRLAAGTEAVISKQNLSRELAINRIRDALRKSGVEAR